MPAVNHARHFFEITQHVFGHAVGELDTVRAVGEQAAERADDGVDHLATERRQAINQNDLAAELGGFERGGNACRACADNANIAGDLLRQFVFAPHGFGAGFYMIRHDCSLKLGCCLWGAFARRVRSA